MASIKTHVLHDQKRDRTVGLRGELGGPSTSRLEQLHKQERHHTLTRNLKAMSLWVLLIIRFSTFTFLSDVGHITHTCTQHSPSSVSPSIHHAPPSSGSSYLLVSSLLFSPQRTDIVPSLLLSAQMDRLPRSYPSSNRGSDTTVGS